MTESREAVTSLRVPIDQDAWYPVYTVYDYPSPSFYVEADAETVERWKRVKAEFEAVQREIQKMEHFDRAI